LKRPRLPNQIKRRSRVHRHVECPLLGGGKSALSRQGALLLKLMNDIVSNAKPLCFVELMPQPANQLAGTLSVEATANQSMSPRVRMGLHQMTSPKLAFDKTHYRKQNRMAIGQGLLMSAFGGKADIARSHCDVCF
jgi:hypothetical protein